MSRIGYLPISLPEGVSVDIDEHNLVGVKGPLGELSQQVNKDIKIRVEDGQISFERPSEQREHKAMHGLYRSLVNNMVIGVSQGYEIKQELVGVGFRAEAKGQRLEMSLGYSHDIIIELPPERRSEDQIEPRTSTIQTQRSADK